LNPNLQRAILLVQQERHEQAINELRQSLTAEPHEPYAHALLGLCLAKLEKFQDATAEAQQAIHLSPDFPFAHYAHASILHDRHRNVEALAAINEALRLDSSDADHFALLANIHVDEKRWREALEAAERGLQLDSENIACTNLRAIALVKLGRKAEAGATIDTALSKNPDNAITHANQGWTLLERGDHKKALEHFREALRLDPENQWARHGIVEALKARNFIYAFMLRYFFWMSRFRGRTQWAIILGGYFGNRLLGVVAASQPSLAPWILPIRILYVAFALMTWIADPLFNLLLRLNRFGRLALSREQVVAANYLGACIFLALVGLAGWIAFGGDGPWPFAAGVFACLAVPVSGIFKCSSGWPRNAMALYSGALALVGLFAIGCFAYEALHPSKGHNRDAGWALFGLFILGAVGSTWLANILVMQRPRR
jgi:tetratricopeptide (TPR) repeat protein